MSQEAQIDRSWSLDNSRNKLEALIEDREENDDWVLPGKKGDASALSIKVRIKAENKFSLPQYVGDSVELKVNADTKCSAVSVFLKNVTSDKICIVVGPEGGHLLGLEGRTIPGFYCYVKKKRL